MHLFCMRKITNVYVFAYISLLIIYHFVSNTYVNENSLAAVYLIVCQNNAVGTYLKMQIKYLPIPYTFITGTISCRKQFHYKLLPARKCPYIHNSIQKFLGKNMKI